MLLGPSGTAFKYIIAIQSTYNKQAGPKKVHDVVMALRRNRILTIRSFLSKIVSFKIKLSNDVFEVHFTLRDRRKFVCNLLPYSKLFESLSVHKGRALTIFGVGTTNLS